VLAVGGITRARFPAVARAGAAGVAAIGLFACAPEPIGDVINDAVHAFSV
jgi:thiamine monophosphate synthase